MPAHAEPTRLRCSRCKQVKGKTKFSRDSTRKNGYFPWCTECQTKYALEHRQQDESAEPNGNTCPVDDRIVRGPKRRIYCSDRCKDKVNHLRKRFGLTVQEFRAMVDAAEGRCPICQKRPTEWHIDHDHSTGLVMGVVCSACNIGPLATTYHDPAFVLRLHAFLTNSPAAQLGIAAIAPTQPAKSQIHRRWGYGAKRKAA